MWNRNLILHQSLNFMLLHVLISLLTRLRLKIFKTRLLLLGWFPRDYRAVVHEENWANCPFKRKLYSLLERLVTLQNMIRYMILDILSGSTLYIRTGTLYEISMR